MERTVVGVLTSRRGHRFHEPLYMRGLVQAGRKLGAEVYMFSNEDVLPRQRQIRGIVPVVNGGWVQRLCPWPDVVIDRRRSDWNPAFIRMRRQPWFPYANSKFVMKAGATRLFAADSRVSKWIPKTVPFSPKHVGRMLEEFPIVYLKPGNGTGGSSIVKVKRQGAEWIVWGRKRSGTLSTARLGSRDAVTRWLQDWVRTQHIRSGRFILQQGLDLELVPTRVVDSRLLIQKDGNGEWKVTGMATRIGGKNSPTTNMLYGDGKAYSFDSFMKERFGAEKATSIREECERLAGAVVAFAEKRFGPMFEFGLDIGIEVDGRVWLIEANPKPSRDVFLKSGDRGLYTIAVRRPIENAIRVARQARGSKVRTAEAGVAGEKETPESKQA